MKTALLSLMAADEAITNLVATRISWGRRNQGEDVPAITLSLVSSPRPMHAKGPDNLVPSRVQVSCFGLTYEAASNTAKAVVGLMNGFVGIQSEVEFQRISIENERDSNQIESGAGRRLFLTSLDLLLWHDE